MGTIRNTSTLLVLALVLFSAFGCKSKKKAMEAAAAEKARIEREAADSQMKADAIAKREAEEKAKREAEARLRERESKVAAPQVRLDQYFNAIAGAGNTTSANTSINEALSMFASPSTPVLIVISEEAGEKDYDKPTTIKDYLNYLKDQRKNMNAISDMKTDGSGKITELELKKTP